MTAITPAQRQLRAASVAPASINEAARTVEVIASTGAERVATDSSGRPYVEALEISATAIDLTRFIGASVLNTHQQFDLASVLGVVTDAWIEGANLMALLHVDDDALWGRVKSGVIRNVSVGYQIDHATLTEREGQYPLVTVTAWRPCEISFVPVPADPGAHTRKETPAMSGATASTPRVITPVAAPAATATAPAQTRAAINAQIRSQAATYGLPPSFADNLIDHEAAADTAGQAILAEAARRQHEQTGAIHANSAGRAYGLDPAQSAQARAEAMGEALYARRHGGHKLSDAARPFAFMPVVEMARASLDLAGVSVHGMAPIEVIERSIGMHTTSDLGSALANFARREAAQGYAAAESGIRAVAKSTTAQDFRTKSKVWLDTDARLEKLSESGEIKQGKLVDGVETYRIDTYAKSIAISRQALVNDDLDAVGDLAGLLGLEAANFEADFLVKLVEANSGAGPKMTDGQPLFHASHSNLANTGAAIAEASVSAGRLAMRRQTSPGGVVLGLGPKFLVVPPELETAGEKFIAAVQAAKSEDTNVFTGKLVLIVEPRLKSATRWYLVADPALVPGLEYAYLAGAPGPQIKTFEPHNQDGLLTRVVLDYGAGFTDFRGWYANPGQ